MVRPGQRSEVRDPLTDLLCRDVRLRVVAGHVEQARPDRHRHRLDLAQIDQMSVRLALHVLWCILLESLLHHILRPVHVSLE